ncbi:hypothetical protein D3C76_1249660 [compost metagenome]
MEKIDIRHTPCYYLLDGIMEEAREVFLHHKITSSVMYQVQDFFNSKLQVEIEAGSFRTKFYTPMNRLAEFERIEVRVDASDPTMLRIVPVWKYISEEHNMSLWDDWEVN